MEEIMVLQELIVTSKNKKEFDYYTKQLYQLRKELQLQKEMEDYLDFIFGKGEL